MNFSKLNKVKDSKEESYKDYSERYDIYKSDVVSEILERLPEPLKKYTIGKDSDILDMIEDFVNENKEVDLRYPDHISLSVLDAFDDGMSVTEYVDEVIDGIKTLLEATAGAM